MVLARTEKGALCNMEIDREEFNVDGDDVHESTIRRVIGWTGMVSDITVVLEMTFLNGAANVLAND